MHFKILLLKLIVTIFVSYEGNHVHVNMIGSELVFDVTSTCTRACTWLIYKCTCTCTWLIYKSICTCTWLIYKSTCTCTWLMYKRTCTCTNTTYCPMSVLCIFIGFLHKQPNREYTCMYM